MTIPEKTRDVLQDLAGAFQRMSEQAGALEKRAESPAVAWWAKGQKEALELCARRARELVDPTVTTLPASSTNAMLAAYEACLQMFESIPSVVEVEAIDVAQAEPIAGTEGVGDEEER